MSNFAGDYTYREVHIVAQIKAYQGNKVGSNNWMKNIYNRIKKLDARSVRYDAMPNLPLPDKGLEGVDVELVTTDKKLNGLLERVQGNIRVTGIEFPLYDVPPIPRCNGSFNEFTGLITHDKKCELAIHQGVKV